MKYIIKLFWDDKLYVAPLVGAWIEIKNIQRVSPLAYVAPLVGAWIEINAVKAIWKEYGVAPLVGAWIEIDNIFNT